MKTKVLLVAFFLSLKGYSQTELSINVSNLLFNEAALTFEKGLNSYLSVGAFGSFQYDLPPTEDKQFINRNVNFGPEVKYYVNPKRGIDGFYIGFYLKESIGTVSTNDNYFNYYGGPPFPYEDLESDFSKLAFGFQLGAKWVTSKNIFFGLNFGLGRNLYNHFENEVMRDYYYNNGAASENFDFKYGFNIGYRFY